MRIIRVWGLNENYSRLGWNDYHLPCEIRMRMIRAGNGAKTMPGLAMVVKNPPCGGFLFEAWRGYRTAVNWSQAISSAVS